MNKKIKKKKALVLSLMLTMGLMSPFTTNAQQYYGGNFGLFGRGDNAENGNRGSNLMEITVNTQDFGQDVPLEGGIAILIGVGMGYLALKRKENEQ